MIHEEVEELDEAFWFQSDANRKKEKPIISKVCN